VRDDSCAVVELTHERHVHTELFQEKAQGPVDACGGRPGRFVQDQAQHGSLAHRHGQVLVIGIGLDDLGQDVTVADILSGHGF